MLSVVREESRRSQVKSLAVAHPPPLGRPPAREIGRARRGTTGMAGSKPRGAVEKVRVPVATRIPTGSKTPGGAGTQTNKTGPVQKQRMTGNGPSAPRASKPTAVSRPTHAHSGRLMGCSRVEAIGTTQNPQPLPRGRCRRGPSPLTLPSPPLPLPPLSSLAAATAPKE